MICPETRQPALLLPCPHGTGACLAGLCFSPSSHLGHSPIRATQAGMTCFCPQPISGQAKNREGRLWEPVTQGAQVASVHGAPASQ